MQTIFQFSGYREALSQVLLDKKAKFGKLFTFEKMAAACRLQRTYLSTVLKGNGHLNSDQVFAACEFLGMNADEYRFISLLHEHDRSIFPNRKIKLESEIAAIRSDALQASNYVSAKPIAVQENPAMVDFYLDLTAQLIHMFLTVKRYRDDPEKIKKVLGIDEIIYKNSFITIERAGLIRRSGKKIEMVVDEFHLPKSSTLYPNYRMQMRLKAIELMQRRSSDQHYSFSVIFSADEELRRKFQARFLELVDWAQKHSSQSSQDEVYQMNFDLLKWSSN